MMDSMLAILSSGDVSSKELAEADRFVCVTLPEDVRDIVLAHFPDGTVCVYENSLHGEYEPA